jgi:uncharacterized cupin superfamily protein
MKRSQPDDAMSESIVMATAATADLEPAPIRPDWILGGTPEARMKKLAKSQDHTSYIMVWDCTPGQFNWHYNKDETVVVISGEVFITNEPGDERRLGPGDIAFFPAGTSCTWRVTRHIRKVAVLRETMPRPLGLGLRAWKGGSRLVWSKLLRIRQLAGRSPLMLPAFLDPGVM